MPVIIRTSQAADFKTIQRLNHDLFRYEDKLDRQTRNLDWPFTEFAVNYFHKAAEGRDGCQAFIAETDGQTVGYLIGAAHPKLYMREPFRVVAEIENMQVVDGYRRQGVGSQLVKAFKTWAAGQGATYLRVGAWSANHPAVKFYQKHGFAIIETVLEQPLHGWHQ